MQGGRTRTPDSAHETRRHWVHTCLYATWHSTNPATGVQGAAPSQTGVFKVVLPKARTGPIENPCPDEHEGRDLKGWRDV